MERDIVVLDKDETILHDKLFPGVSDFIERQKKRFRKLVVATQAGRIAEDQLTEIRNELDGFYGLEDLGIRESFYIFPDGNIAQWTKPDRNTSFLEQFWHFRRKKRLLKQGARSYKNPHLSEIDSALILKDLYVLRWLLAPETFRSLRMILVSDAYDVKNLASDPQTPQILVAPDGTWLSRQRVDQLLDVLFSNPNHPPHEIFDNLLASGSSQPTGLEHHEISSIIFNTVVRIITVRKVIISLLGIPFFLAQTEQGGRIAYENPHPPPIIS